MSLWWRRVIYLVCALIGFPLCPLGNVQINLFLSGREGCDFTATVWFDNCNCNLLIQLVSYSYLPITMVITYCTVWRDILFLKPCMWDLKKQTLNGNVVQAVLNLFGFKHIEVYTMGCHDILHRYLWYPENRFLWTDLIHWMIDRHFVGCNEIWLGTFRLTLTIFQW